jgi:hypothetical protein
MHAKRVAALLALVAATALPGVSSAHGRLASLGTAIPRYQHIFYIMMENHASNQIIGNTASAPTINSLASTYGLATNYYGITHPSEPNYVASIGGSYFGIQDDAPYSSTGHVINAPSLADQLQAAGLTWKTYQQSLPYDGYKGTRWPTSGPVLYASKHNGFLNFASLEGQTEQQLSAYIVQDTELATDLQSGRVPNLSYIVPDQCHDMHGTSPNCPGAVTANDANDQALIAAGDAYVASTVSLIMGSSIWPKGNNAIVVTWDEDDFSPTNLGCCDANPGGGQVATIVIANNGPRGIQDATPYNHYSLLLSIEQAFRLPCLQNACDAANVKPMIPLFAGSNS